LFLLASANRTNITFDNNTLRSYEHTIKR